MQDHSSRRARHALGIIVMAAVMTTTFPAAAGAKFAQADPPTVAANAATWLVQQHDTGQVTASGALADLIFALVGSGSAPDTVAAARAELEDAIATYVAEGGSDEGTLAKALLAVRVGGGAEDIESDPEARLRAAVQAEGADAGRVGDASTFSQALAVMALATTAGGAPAEAVAWLADQRCPEGGFEYAPSPAATSTAERSAGFAEGTERCTTEGAGHIDTTAMAVQALLGHDSAAATTDAAVEWLVGQQAGDGGFAENANSTGLAAQALRAVGDVEAADRAAQFVSALQIADGPDAGAIRFRTDDPGSLYLATTQGILALGAPAFPAMSSGEAALPVPVGEGCDADEGVTVIVDLTFFDAGVLQGCAAGDPASGLEALLAAGFATETQTSDFGEYVCAIEGLPELACEQPFEGQFWAYFSGAADGSWSTQQVGADAADPEPGAVEGWRYSEGDPPSIASNGTAVRRLAGADRIATAVAVSRATFPGGNASGAVLARADDFADALAGTPLAVAVGGPLLITSSDALTAAVAEELQRVLPTGGAVHVLGGTAAIDDAVLTQVQELGYRVERVAGADRVTTAIAVAGEIGAPSTLLITTGYGFADALAAGSAAALSGDGAVLLTGDGEPHPAVDAYLEDRPDAEVLAIGGPAAAAYPEATAIVGTTREGTAVAVAEAFAQEPPTVGIARRDEFADALAGGAHTAVSGGPLLLTPSDELSPEVAAYLCRTDSIGSAVLYGGTAALTDPLGAQVADALTGGACT